MEKRIYIRTTMYSKDKKWLFIIEKNDPNPPSLNQNTVSVHHCDYASADEMNLTKEQVLSLRNALDEFLNEKNAIDAITEDMTSR